MIIVSENRFSGKTYFYTIASRCEPCQVKFERVTELRRHREDVHLGKARLFCEVEGCKFHTW